MANIANIQKALYSQIPTIGPSILYPFKYLQNIPYTFKFLANIPVSLKTLPGLQHWQTVKSCFKIELKLVNSNADFSK